MIARALIFSFGCMLCLDVYATELVPFANPSAVGVTIKDMAFPDRFSKDLTSGLTNKLVMRVDLIANTKVISQRVIILTIKYDLWGENFKIVSSVADGESVSQTFTSLKDVLAFLAALKVPKLWSGSEVPKSSALTLQAEAILNPIEKEQLEKIKIWVAQNSATASVDPTGLSSAKPAAPARSNALFNTIFDQYSKGADVASVWRSSFSSNSFRLNEITHEK